MLANFTRKKDGIPHVRGGNADVIESLVRDGG